MELFDSVTSALTIGEIYSKLSQRIHYLSLLFGFRFDCFFQTKLDAGFEARPEIYTKLCHLFCDSYRALRGENDVSPLETAANFFRGSKFYDRPFLPIFIDSIISFLKPIVDSLFESSLTEYLAGVTRLCDTESQLCASLFKSANRVNDSIYNIIFTSKLEAIYERGLLDLIEKQDSESVCTCARFARATNLIGSFTDRLASIFAHEAARSFSLDDPVQYLIHLHRDISTFCDRAFGPQTARVIRSSFERGLNLQPDSVARLLATSINRHFKSGAVDPELIEHYVALFKMLSLNDVFEISYTQLLKRRVLTMKSDVMQSEKEFLQKLREQCGVDYTKRMDQLIEDLETSRRLSQEFRARRKTCPSYLQFLIFSNENWQTLRPLEMVPPAEIGTAQSAFEKFYRTQKGGRVLSWILALSDVTLTVKNVDGVQKVRCSAEYATILLALNSRSRLSISAIAAETGAAKDEIDSKVHELMSKRANRILTRRGTDVWVQVEATAPRGKIRIPLVTQGGSVPDDPKPKAAVVSNQDSQIDAAVVLVLKAEKAMDREALREIVRRQLIGLEDAAFDARLAKLQSQEFIRIEPSGRVHYLP
jgi:hypothetical protein